jgi:hypothetical protein
MIALLDFVRTSVQVERQFVAKVLSPYLEHSTYLKEVTVTSGPRPAAASEGAKDVSALGAFSIDQSCYIQSTGHFNAVEFNICFNQLAYTMYAHCFATGFFQQNRPEWGDRLSLFNPASFERNQLSSMLITNFSSKFKKEIRGGQFYGELEIGRIRAKGNCVFTTNHVAFFDDHGGYSEGDVTLAFVARD